MARVFARMLGRLLPGNPTLIVRNMPGGGGTIGVNYVYASKPDGLTLLNSGGNVQLAYLLGQTGVHYDMLKMTALIGRPAGQIYLVRTGVVAKPEDLPKTQGIVFGHAAGGSVGYVFVAAKELLVFPAKVILAYGGGADARRALLSGEINTSGDNSGAYPTSMAQYVAKGELVPLFQSGIVNDKGNLVREAGAPPDVPTVEELYKRIYGKSPSGIAWDAYKAVLTINRNYMNVCYLPPGTPDSIARAYWGASEALLNDPEFLKAALDLTGEGQWGAGEVYDKSFKANMGMVDPKSIDWFKDIMATKYGAVFQ